MMEEYTRVIVYDSKRKEFRAFELVPPDPKFKVRCANDLHQFDPLRIFRTCACGTVTK